jgi:hypothetical protein
MLEALPFAFTSTFCCDCVVVQAAQPRIVAVASYELLSDAAAADGEAAPRTGVGGQMRTGALDFFSVAGEELRHSLHLPCAAGDV